MPATVTLATATLTYSIDSAADEVTLSSAAGILAGTRLWISSGGRGELMRAISANTTTNKVKVIRGVDGTASSPHTSSDVVTIGRADQFYGIDPMGDPPASIPVSPYINVIRGKVWLAQGDPLPDGSTARWWQEVTSTYSTGSLGILTSTSFPTAST